MKKLYCLTALIVLTFLVILGWKGFQTKQFYYFQQATLSDNHLKMEQQVKLGYDINDTLFGRKHLQFYLAGRQKNLNYTTINKMFELGYKLSEDNGKSMPEIHYCIMAGDIRAVKLLLAKGANINVQTKSGVTPLDLALFLKQYKIANYLMQYTKAEIVSGRREDIMKMCVLAVKKGELSTRYLEKINKN